MSAPIKTYSIDEFNEIVNEAHLPSYRSMQILTWVYVKHASSYEEMTNLPKVIREQFNIAHPLYNPYVVVKRESVDGSRKYLLRFNDGALAETVGLPSEDGRLTVCCSSQAGCAMGCTFCATGKMGLTRSLSPGEILDQLLIVQDDFKRRITNVVMMGQGEPFSNYEASLAALRIMNHPKLLNIGARHITISTCGLIKGIERFSNEEEQFTLAVSLHAARQEVRDRIMPGMKNQPIVDLRNTLINYSNETGRRFTLEYALMKDVNDSFLDLDALITFCSNTLCHVNLIPLNRVEESEYLPVENPVMHHWKEKLEERGISSTVRKSLGSDIEAACGQLSSEELKSFDLLHERTPL